VRKFSLKTGDIVAKVRAFFVKEKYRDRVFTDFFGSIRFIQNSWRITVAYHLVPFYNIDSSVGRHGANNREDVLLVQFFLSEIGKRGPHPLPPPSNKLSVDGNADSTLEEWIEWFQMSVREVQGAGAFDKRVDPARTMNTPAKQKNDRVVFDVGTMAALNITYRKRFKNEHDCLAKAGNCPVELRANFSVK